jgi:hypothetical protein
MVAPDTPTKRARYTLPAPEYERARFLASTPDEVTERLLRYGVAVLPDAIGDPRPILEGVWRALEATFPDFRHADPSTWRTLRDNGAKHGMLLQTHGLGWCQPVVDVRQDPRLARLFAAIWTARDRRLFPEAESERPIYTPSDLLSSSDGLSVYLNTPESRGGYHRHDWLHWDRSPNDKTPSLQGFVNLLPTMEGGAALQVLTKSHRHQRAFAARFPSTRNARFHLLADQAQADFYAHEMGCAHVCVAADPRDLVLWDSRLIHCGRAAARGARTLKRVVIYTSMQPRRYATPKDLERKRRAYAQRRTTTHNAASGVDLFAVYPRVRCAQDEAFKRRSTPVRAPVPTLTPLGKVLFGLI